MKVYFISLLFCFTLASSCKKEGLSKSTGNIEIEVPSGNGMSQWQYEIYTETQFAFFLDYLPATAIRSGFSHIGIIEETGLLQGQYGIYFYQNGTGYKRTFIITANKNSKLVMP